MDLRYEAAGCGCSLFAPVELFLAAPPIGGLFFLGREVSDQTTDLYGLARRLAQDE